MVGFGVYRGDKAVLLDEDRKMVATLVDRSAVIQDDYSNCTDEKIKEKLAMDWHTTRRSFDQFVFFSSGNKEEWKAAVERGLVISLAKENAGVSRGTQKQQTTCRAAEDQRAQLRRPGVLAGRELVSTSGVLWY
jgi:hypothetical protein